MKAAKVRGRSGREAQRRLLSVNVHRPDDSPAPTSRPRPDFDKLSRHSAGLAARPHPAGRCPVRLRPWFHRCLEASSRHRRLHGASPSGRMSNTCVAVGILRRIMRCDDMRCYGRMYAYPGSHGRARRLKNFSFIRSFSSVTSATHSVSVCGYLCAATASQSGAPSPALV